MKKLTLILFMSCLLAACKNEIRYGNTPTVGKADLVEPANNTVCLQGVKVSDIESTVTFKWNAVAAVGIYDLTIKNLADGTETTKSVTGTQMAVTIKSNAPYSWYVTSKANNSTTKSDVWKFYNAGTVTANYAPFPADIISPAMLEQITGPTVDFKWTGSDPDNDELTYDLYCGTDTFPERIKANLTTGAFSGFAVTSGRTYYWKVLSRDSKGNTSETSTFKFSVK